MGKVKKIILITLLSIVAIAFLLSVCYLGIKAMLPEEDRQTVVTREVLEYLNERYNEEFEVVNFISPEPYHNFYKITAYPKGQPQEEEQKITIHGWITKGGKNLFKKETDKITFYDNYAVVRLIPELKKKISDLVLKKYPECKIHMTFHREWIQKNVNEYASAEEFLEKDEYWKQTMSVDIFTFNESIEDKESLKKYSDNLFLQLFNNNFDGSAEIYFYSNANIYEKLDNSLGEYGAWRYENEYWGKQGKDFIYCRCDFFKKDGKIEIDFRD